MKRLFSLLVLFAILGAWLLPVARRKAADAAAGGGLRLLESSAAGVRLVMDTPQYDLVVADLPGPATQRLSVPGYDASVEPGHPQLPVKNALIAVPPDAEVELKIGAADTRVLPGSYRLALAPSPVPLDEDLQPGELRVQPGPGLSAGQGLYPQSPAVIADDAWLRDRRMVRVAIYPFQYDPQTGELRWNRRLEVQLNFMHPAGPQAAAPAGGCLGDCEAPGLFDDSLSRAVLNFDQAWSWRARPPKSALRSQSSPQGGGTRYKIVVDQDGLYRLSYAELQAAGVPVASANIIANYGLTNQGRPVAFHVQGDGDGTFEPGESLAFYGERFRGDYLASYYGASMQDWLWKCTQGCQLAGMFEKYTDENVYWLTVNGPGGPQMAAVNGTPSGGTPAPYYMDIVHLEESSAWFTHHFSSEDTWFWERIQPGTSTVTRTYTTTLTALATGSLTATVRAEIVSRSENAAHYTRFYLNGDPNPIDDAVWYGKTNHKFEAQVPHSQLNNGVNALDFTIIYSGTVQDMYFNWFEIEYGRQFVAQNDQLKFAYDTPGTWVFPVSNLQSATAEIYDLTNPLLPVRITTDPVLGGTISFQASPASGAQYLVVGTNAELDPKSITAYTPRDFGAAGAEYIFITHPDLMAGTQALADYRAAQGYSTMVVSVEELYNQFNFGIFHTIAIREFLAQAMSSWATPPEYVLLVGGGHWNLKGYPGYSAPPVYMPPNLAFVDPWQGEVDSANLLAAVVGNDVLADLIIARLPANSSAELATMVDKTIGYERQVRQDWQNQIVFVADDTPDAAGDFVALSESVISTYVDPSPYHQAERIYLDDFEDLGNCGASTSTRPCPNINNAITTTLNITGTLLVNFVGHASIDRWAGEKVFINQDIPSLTNGDMLPVFLSMTCLDGYWIYPDRESLVYDLLRTEGKGGVATFSATGLGVATGHDYLHNGFYSALFQDRVWQLGYAATAAKLNLYASGTHYDLIHTFTIFGDPALQIINRNEQVFMPGLFKSYPGG